MTPGPGHCSTRSPNRSGSPPGPTPSSSVPPAIPAASTGSPSGSPSSRRPASSAPPGAFPRKPGWHNAEMRTIALEEHFWTAELAAPPGTGPLATWGQRVDDQLRDLGASRLADMDASGIDFQVISHVGPAAQGLGGAEGISRAREANDRLAGAVRAHPDRFAGFATLPTANPQAAADELERAVCELGLLGAMVNSTLGSNGTFLDDAGFAPLLDRFERLDVPLYLHPAPPSAALRDALYHGLPPALAGPPAPRPRGPRA